MAVTIRLARHGSKKSPFYRIVVTDKRNARDGRFIEKLGTFDPNVEKGFVVNHERVTYWRGQGAKPSATVDRLLKKNPAAAAPAGS